VARRAMLEQQRSFIHGRKMHSQGATSQRSNDYFSPTVSSIMKKRNNSEQPTRPKQSAVHSSPRWMFWLVLDYLIPNEIGNRNMVFMLFRFMSIPFCILQLICCDLV
jgi:hypothetical protein